VNKGDGTLVDPVVTKNQARKFRKGKQIFETTIYNNWWDEINSRMEEFFAKWIQQLV
jgi:hypothetical protein